MSVEVRVPQVTQTMSECTIIRWLKREGETVEAGEPLFEMETDKAAVEVESPGAGRLGRILVASGAAPVGGVVAVILASGENQPERAFSAAATPIAPRSTATAGQPPSPLGREAGPTGRLRVSPPARRLASEHGVDLGSVVPTGPGGLITEGDVQRRLKTAPVSSALTEGEEIIPLTGVRKTIADRLSLSRRTAADVTTIAEIDMTEIAALREHEDITYTAFVAAATVMALAEFPILNSRLQDDKIIISKAVHLGVAVALDEGLKVPVIRDAHTKDLRQMAAELADLAKRGAAGQLAPAELTGSTFTLTNSGVFGAVLFTPIINPPESAILGMGRIAKTPVVLDDRIVIRRMMYLCLTYDHRVIDGAPAVKFLQRVKLLLEKPGAMLSSESHGRP
ncbi:MAG TPA: dihydrolipoamide acetyltransferase family protein [Candidatus Methylomirabilis sp.]|nr:dihydrolipoamide acetyltransferase family protein [Candidatus Methylomirabilis sp.]